MHRTDKSSQHSSIIWPGWLNSWVFVYRLSGCGFESSWGQLIVTVAEVTEEKLVEVLLCPYPEKG